MFSHGRIRFSWFNASSTSFPTVRQVYPSQINPSADGGKVNPSECYPASWLSYPKYESSVNTALDVFTNKTATHSLKKGSKFSFVMQLFSNRWNLYANRGPILYGLPTYNKPLICKYIYHWKTFSRSNIPNHHQKIVLSPFQQIKLFLSW